MHEIEDLERTHHAADIVRMQAGRSLRIRGREPCVESLLAVALRFLFAFILIAMLAVTGWASSQVALWNIPASVGGHPWFVATLFDTYFAFLTFYCWVAYKETSNLARIVWLLAILLLGNIAMAIYMLWKLAKLPPEAKIEALLLRGT